MTVETKTLEIDAKSELDIINITGDVYKSLSESKIKNGLVNIFVAI